MRNQIEKVATFALMTFIVLMALCYAIFPFLCAMGYFDR